MAKTEQHTEAPETVIGATVKVEGDLISEGDIKVDGFVTGTVKTSRNLYVGPSAKIEASVEAGNAVLAGAVKGDVKVEERLELQETGSVEGNIVCGMLHIAEGAYFAGMCQMPQQGQQELAEPLPEEEVAEE